MPKKSAKKILILCHDTAGRKMAGPGLRYVALTKELSRHFRASLAVQKISKEDIDYLKNTHEINATSYNKKSFATLFQKFDYVYGQELSLEMLEFNKAHGIKTIIDLYAPVPVEFMASKHFSPSGFGSLEQAELKDLNNKYSAYLQHGDYFTCSNERQRDFWTGFMMASGSYSHSDEIFSNLDSLFGIVPMGIPPIEPEHSQKVLRETIDGISQDDFVLLWTGGLWDWFDPLMTVKAVEQARISNPKIKLVFMGFRHPNKKVPHMRAAKDTLAYVEKQNLENTAVFFIDTWVEYDKHIDYLLEADAAIYAHKPSLETRLSHRTRVLDHIHANLPTIATSGDFLADELIAPKKLGFTCDASFESLAKAITQLANDAELRTEIKKNILKVKPEFYWSSATEPLVSFIKSDKPIREKSFLQHDSNSISNERKWRHILQRILRKVRQHVR